MNLEGLIKFEEELTSHICRSVAENCREELKIIGRDPSELERIEPPFERLTYEQIIGKLRNLGVDIRIGDDIGGDEEYMLTRNLDKPIFMVGYPLEKKPFYVKEDPDKPGTGLTVDLLAPEGYGEMATGGEREDNVEKLTERIRREGFNPEDYEWYLDLRRYGSVPHSGFGMGIDRLTWWICKLEHVRDALPFPRMARTRKFI